MGVAGRDADDGAMDMRVGSSPRDPRPGTRQIHHIVVATRCRQRYFEPFASACAAARAFTDRRTLGGAHLLAWVLMPDHAHWLLQADRGEDPAQVVVRMKARSCNAVNRLRGEKRPVWASAYDDTALPPHENPVELARFIVATPLRAGLARTLADYPFWDAAWL